MHTHACMHAPRHTCARAHTHTHKGRREGGREGPAQELPLQIRIEYRQQVEGLHDDFVAIACQHLCAYLSVTMIVYLHTVLHGGGARDGVRNDFH